MTDHTSEQLEKVADLCRQARDNILTHGWKQGATTVDQLGHEIDGGLCIGSALAMAADKIALGIYGDRFDAFAFAGNPALDLCADGKVFHEYATAINPDIGKAEMWEWNDDIATADSVLDLLIGCEKAMREDAARHHA